MLLPSVGRVTRKTTFCVAVHGMKRSVVEETSGEPLFAISYIYRMAPGVKERGDVREW